MSHKRISVLYLIKDPKGGTGTFLNQLKRINSRRMQSQWLMIRDLGYDFVDERFSLRKLISFLRLVLRFNEKIVELKPKILFTAELLPLVVGLLSKVIKRSAYRIVYFVNINLEEYLQNKPGIVYRFLLFQMLKIVLPQADVVITPSSEMSQKLSKKYSLKKITTIPHAIEISKVKPILKKHSFFTFISVSRLELQKDYGSVIRALHMLHKNGLDFEYRIIGSGSEQEHLKLLTRQLGIENFVRFLGWKEDVHEHLSQADCFIFSSHYEAFGIAIIEAMASRLPVIASDSPYGPREILDYGAYGLLFPVGDVHELSKQMLKVSIDSKLRTKLRRLSLKRSKFYSLDKMLDRYYKLFGQIA